MLSRPALTLSVVSLTALALAACDPRLPASRDAPDPNAPAEAPPLRVDVTDRQDPPESPPPPPAEVSPERVEATNPDPDPEPARPAPTPVVEVRPEPPRRPAPVDVDEPRFTPAGATHCRADERTLYTCPFEDGRVLSVCVGDDIAYRFGAVEDPELELIRDPGSDGVHYGVNRRRGEGRQSQVRFENGDYDYIVYSSEAGRRGRGDGESGVVVLRGGEVIQRLECPVAAPETAMRVALIRDEVPRERRDGRYDAWW